MINQIKMESPYGTIELVEIVDDNGNATQMPKSVYDEQQAALAEQAKPTK